FLRKVMDKQPWLESDFSPQQREVALGTTVKYMYRVDVPFGEYVIKQGEKSHAFIVIEHGWFERIEETEMQVDTPRGNKRLRTDAIKNDKDNNKNGKNEEEEEEEEEKEEEKRFEMGELLQSTHTQSRSNGKATDDDNNDDDNDNDNDKNESIKSRSLQNEPQSFAMPRVTKQLKPMDILADAEVLLVSKTHHYSYRAIDKTDTTTTATTATTPTTTTTTTPTPTTTTTTTTPTSQYSGASISTSISTSTLGTEVENGDVQCRNHPPKGCCRVWILDYEKYLKIREKLQSIHAEETRERMEFLKTVPLFQQPESQFDFRSISYACTRFHFQDGQIIVREGDHAQYVYIVQKGECCAYRNSTQVVRHFGISDAFGIQWMSSITKIIDCTGKYCQHFHITLFFSFSLCILI
ncbi:hypothetical protein RFI_12252, partial [Reticulomyxa filosa]